MGRGGEVRVNELDRSIDERDQGFKFGTLKRMRVTILQASSQLILMTLIVGMLIVGQAAVAAAQPAAADSISGKPVPRFVSLKASRVNLRKGPGTDYPTAWVFRRAGLPVEIIREFEVWRQVRDADGTTGWVIRTLLSGRRTVQISPWEVKADSARPQVPILAGPSQGSRQLVIVESGVIADLYHCDGQWCRVAVEDYKGYIQQKKLWGVYEGETVR